MRAAAPQDTARVAGPDPARADTLRRAGARADSLPTDSLRLAFDCEGRRISEIRIRTQPPYPDGILRRWKALARAVTAYHSTTEPDVIRRFLVMHVGETCTELRRAETERTLRAQPFLADAAVVPHLDGAGGVVLDVVTTDEVSAVVGLTVSGGTPYVSALKLGDGNVSGEAMYVAVRWEDGLFYRDLLAVRLVDYQLFGRTYQLALDAERRQLGERWAAEFSHPFLTDFQRVAWHTSAGASRTFFRFLREDVGHATAVDVDRRHADIGGLLRIGVPGRLSLFGFSVSGEWVDPASAAVIISDSGLVPDTTAALAGRFAAHRSARLNALWGVRNIRFMRVVGFDALSGVQDVRRGFQLSTLLGRSLGVLGSEDDDIFASANLYAANGTPSAFVALEALAEGRQDYDRNRWDAVLASGRAAAYLRTVPRHTLITSVEWSAGWRARVPFQLRLSDLEGGVRGYQDSRATGSQRGVIRIEDRWFWGRPFGLADAGVAAFADFGKLWRGDDPFGVDTRTKIGVGMGLLVGVPPRSKRLWRVDLAFPVSSDPHARWELRLSNRDQTRIFWDEPNDLTRSRSVSVPTSVFNWP